jgi:hypothetical protein
MFSKKSISRMVTVLLIIMFLLSGVLPVQAEPLASPLYASGDFLWAKSMGGTGSDQGNGIAVDSSSNVYTTGTFQDTVDFDSSVSTPNLTSAGSYDIFVSKLENRVYKLFLPLILR